MLLVGAIEKPKGRPSKRRSLLWEKNHQSDSILCAKNSDILLAENSLMDTEISISDEGHMLNALPQKGIWEKIVLSTPYGTNEECSENYVGSSNAMEVKAFYGKDPLKIVVCDIKAIKDNAPDVRKMKSAILASLFHCSSTDKTPKHSKCPTGSTSLLLPEGMKNENPMSHSLMKTKLSEQVLEKYFQYIKGL
ncbi:uncharacterized protein TNCV_119871 [Trichonephila clavipes]|nr:uncharacterized protein TNCV_119871 [Trichonephila clavipes]